jgi:hypothetical protein
MSDTARKQLDYDDVDPVQLNDAEGRILFVSSRSPDLGRDHARRSTTLWLLRADGLKQPAGGNRNNDRLALSFEVRLHQFHELESQPRSPLGRPKRRSTIPHRGKLTHAPNGLMANAVHPDSRRTLRTAG